MLWLFSSAMIRKGKRDIVMPEYDFEREGTVMDTGDDGDFKKPFSYDDEPAYEYDMQDYTHDMQPAVSSMQFAESSLSDTALSEELDSVQKKPAAGYIFKDGFELDKAVVYSILINPKYKEY